MSMSDLGLDCGKLKMFNPRQLWLRPSHVSPSPERDTFGGDWDWDPGIFIPTACIPTNAKPLQDTLPGSRSSQCPSSLPLLDPGMQRRCPFNLYTAQIIAMSLGCVCVWACVTSPIAFLF